MALWLFKEEPEYYSFDDLVRDGRTVWNGVTNALALQYLRKVNVGDRVLYYHTGKQKAVVGEMRVVAGPRSETDDPKSVVVEVEPVRAFDRAVSLATIKGDESLADWDLVRLPRLSVMAVTEEQWRRIEQLSRADQ